MEIQLNELIDKIKKDGVDAARTEADATLAEAKSQAEEIVSQARAEADRIVSEARRECDRMTRSSEDAIRQAGRNVLISFRESVAKELERIVGEDVKAVYSSDAFSDVIVKAVENWTADPDGEDISVLLNSEDLERLEDTLNSKLKEKLEGGVTLTANDSFDGGFRIASKDGGAYYDYSAEAVTEMLSKYLSPRVTALLKECE